MLKFFSRLERTRNLVLLVFAIVMAVSLVIFYAPTRDNLQASLASSSETVAKVGGESVTVGELIRQKDVMGRMYGGRPPASKQILDGMINERMVSQEAERLGLTATDAEVAAEIREQNKPTDGRPFDVQRYQQNVAAQFGSVSAYEEMVRDTVSGNKLEAFLTSGVTVSEQELIDDFKKRNTKYDLTYVPVNVADVAQNITPSEEEMKQFFELNKANYFISAPQKKIRYVFVNTAKIGEKLQIPEAELKTEYDNLPEDRKQAGVQGQQLVLRIPNPDTEAKVLEKANELVQQARKEGGKISEQAFAELAQGQSEDPATARSGGKIPGLVRQNPNNPTDPYQRLLTLQEGEVTEPIKFGGRYYILRRGASVPKSFEDARKELEVSLRNRRAYTIAAELAGKITEDLKQTKDAQATAQKFAAEANMTPAEMVRETDFVKPGDEVPNVGISPQFEEGIAGLQNPNDVGEKIPIRDGFGIPLLLEKREPRDAAFEEVKNQVAEAVKLEKARAQLGEISRQIIEGAKNAAGLSAAAQSKGLKTQESKSFILGSPLGSGPSAATNEELENAIRALEVGQVTPQPIQIADNYYIVGVVRREEADMNEFAKQRDVLARTALEQKRSQVFSDFMAATRQRLEAAGQIKIFPEALNKVDNLDPEAEI
jgi:peptidyl-prolyl cis-trans isomerase D